jgi:hypothetical protein
MGFISRAGHGQPAKGKDGQLFIFTGKRRDIEERELDFQDEDEWY